MPRRSRPAAAPPPTGLDSCPGADEQLGRRRFLRGVGTIAGAGAVASVLPGGAAHAALPAGASRFVPLPTAVRLADTRSPARYDHREIAANRIRVRVAGTAGVPASASAVVLTTTAVNGGAPNWVAVLPTGAGSPSVSNLNLPRAGEVNANLVTVKVGVGGQVDVVQRVACDVIVDVLGYYEPVGGAVRGGRFVGLTTARRAIDTRPAFAGARSFTTVDVTSFVPADASSVVVNLTATECTGPGYFTALPHDAPNTEPSTSSLNVLYPGDTRASAVIVPVSTSGGRRRIKIFTLTPAKLVVDVNGYFTGPTSPLSEAGLFVPVDPVRILDTREPGQLGKLWPQWVVEAPVPGEGAGRASAVVVNVTGADSRGPGFFTVSAARLPIPGTSNVNWAGPGAFVPNHVITPITRSYGLQVYSSHGAFVIVDYAGYFTGSQRAPQLPEYANPAPPAAPPEWTLRVPRIGLASRVLAGDPNVVTDSGHSWHWAGTGYMGQDAHVGLFAHRTDAGGPYRNLHLLQAGDTFTVTTGDRREYTYRMVRRDLTDAANHNILRATRLHPGTTLSLIACTVGYDTSKSAYPNIWAPTSLKYRIIITGELVSWREF